MDKCTIDLIGRSAGVIRHYPSLLLCVLATETEHTYYKEDHPFHNFHLYPFEYEEIVLTTLVARELRPWILFFVKVF